MCNLKNGKTLKIKCDESKEFYDNLSVILDCGFIQENDISAELYEKGLDGNVFKKDGKLYRFISSEHYNTTYYTITMKEIIL